MKEYGTYLFDLYGTLIDIRTNQRKQSLWKTMFTYFGSFGADYESPKQLETAYFDRWQVMEKALAQQLNTNFSEIDVRDVFCYLLEHAPASHMANKRSLINSPDFLESTAVMFRILSQEKCRLYKNTLSVLTELKKRGKKLYLLSNAQRPFTMPEMELLGLPSFFDALYISSDYRIRKPEPRFMELLLEKEHVDRSDCVMVGNDFTSDIRCACACGIPSVFLNTFRIPEGGRELELTKLRAEYGSIVDDVTVIPSGDIIALLK